MHTKGKWTVDKSGTSIGVGSGKTYKQIAMTLMPGFVPDEEQLANARLIAAAPDLLEACRDFIGGWVHFCDHIDFGKSNLDAESIRFMNEVPGKIRSALAKAERIG